MADARWREERSQLAPSRETLTTSLRLVSWFVYFCSRIHSLKTAHLNAPDSDLDFLRTLKSLLLTKPNILNDTSWGFPAVFVPITPAENRPDFSLKTSDLFVIVKGWKVPKVQKYKLCVDDNSEVTNKQAEICNHDYSLCLMSAHVCSSASTSSCYKTVGRLKIQHVLEVKQPEAEHSTLTPQSVRKTT